jgi:ribosomal protein S7
MQQKTLKLFRKAILRRLYPHPPLTVPRFNYQVEKGNLVRTLFGYFVKRGKREVARKTFLKMFFSLKFQYQDLDEYFHKVFTRPRPVFGLRPKRLGAAIYKLPFMLSEAKRSAIVIKWIAQSIRMRSGETLLKRILSELNDIFEERKSSLTIQKCTESTRLALYNRGKMKRNRKFRRRRLRTRRFRAQIISN